MRSFQLAVLCLLCTVASAAELDQSLATVREASATTAADDQLREAWKSLADADADQIPQMLRGMDAGNPAAENWIRAAVDAVASRTLSDGEELPKQDLVTLLDDTNAAPRARRTTYEWLLRIDPAMAESKLTAMTEDPSLEMRYDAIAAGMKGAEAAEGLEKVAAYRRLLKSARDLEQIKACKSALEEAGETVDLAAELGFVTQWRVIGVFDNTDKSGFDVAYPPEEEIDFDATYDGKAESAQWQQEVLTTDAEQGEVNLNDEVGAKKGAVVYAYAEVEVPQAQAAQIRYSSNNATKLWVNDRQVGSHEVYHSGGDYDQYAHEVDLQAGKNTILLKVCQNEQTEPWAQDWSYSLRICDALGGAIEMTQSTK